MSVAGLGDFYGSKTIEAGAYRRAVAEMGEHNAAVLARVEVAEATRGRDRRTGGGKEKADAASGTPAAADAAGADAGRLF
jgi:hypothetical protein